MKSRRRGDGERQKDSGLIQSEVIGSVALGVIHERSGEMRRETFESPSIVTEVPLPYKSILYGYLRSFLWFIASSDLTLATRESLQSWR